MTAGPLEAGHSFELLARDVVHRQVVHVGFDELEGLLLNHPRGLRVYHAAQLLDHVSADALALFARLVEGVADDLLDIVERLDALSQTQAEVAKPFVVQRDCPVLA